MFSRDFGERSYLLSPIDIQEQLINPSDQHYSTNDFVTPGSTYACRYMLLLASSRWQPSLKAALQT